MFLGVTASVTNWDADGTCCSIVLEDNPLVDFVELPDTCQGLYYCNILSGVVRGALEMVSCTCNSLFYRTALTYAPSEIYGFPFLSLELCGRYITEDNFLFLTCLIDIGFYFGLYREYHNFLLMISILFLPFKILVMEVVAEKASSLLVKSLSIYLYIFFKLVLT